MKTVLMMALLCFVGCVDTRTSSTEQELCKLDPDKCPGFPVPPIEDHPVSIGGTPADAEAAAREIGGSTSCSWDRCGDQGGYRCMTPSGASCLLTRQGYLFCSTSSCFNTDLVCYSYRCPDWRYYHPAD
jgi:hypothetical protein